MQVQAAHAAEEAAAEDRWRCGEAAAAAQANADRERDGRQRAQQDARATQQVGCWYRLWIIALLYKASRGMF